MMALKMLKLVSEKFPRKFEIYFIYIVITMLRKYYIYSKYKKNHVLICREEMRY